jgi:hydroxymethylglutaryl-CoA reductase
MILKNSANSSRIPGFYKKSLEKRLEIIKKLANLTNTEIQQLKQMGNLGSELAEKCSENVIGGISFPFSIATNFCVNSKDVLIPMVTEESSVVAAASFGAKIARKHGGFSCKPVKNFMIGQIQIIPKNSQQIRQYLKQNQSELIEFLNSHHPKLISKEGGAKLIEIRNLSTIRGEMMVLHLHVNVSDAMGANIVDTMTENLARELEGNIEGEIRAKIVSNLPIQRICKCTAIFDKDLLGGDVIVERILDLYALAQIDPYRSVTHNKGIMNGIIALALATGNDTRALEAGAHAYAALSGSYQPLSSYSKNEDGNLVGKISIPLAMGIVGGLIKIHPVCKIALKILGVKTASELIQIAAAVGLAQNVAALRALSDEGIQKSHMRLHRRKL